MTKQRIAAAFAPVLAALALVAMAGPATAALTANGTAKDGLSVPGASTTFKAPADVQGVWYYE